jgi:hypothetical protein
MTWECEMKGLVELYYRLSLSSRLNVGLRLMDRIVYSMLMLQSKIYRVNSLAFTVVAAAELSPLAAHTNP